ncbi:hypothetical protein ACHAW5_004622 [Stephanodiscus triporus]|uniref:Uncharacterized protein n=1 Tax=Stephanodiscus triporus TaxID=2934178 RepID=A0ABD3QXB5_9STRA
MTDNRTASNEATGKLDLTSGEGGEGQHFNDADNKDTANHASDKQISVSFERLGEIQAKSIELVNEVRAKTDQREAKRRTDEDEDGKRRDELLQRVPDSRRNDEVASGWEQSKESMRGCLAKLDHIGKELGSELREKDHEYVTALTRNHQEVESCSKESLITDRDFILNAHKDELEALTSKRKEKEIESLERQRNIIDEHRNGIKECESKGERNREELKEELENEVRRLEIELEDTRARYQFDSDKLEYNVRVLTELSEKRGGGKEEINLDLEENHQARSRGIRQNNLLEADCERIEKQSSGLKEKFERFKVSDDEKYRAVRSMHRDDLRKLQAELKQSQELIFGGVIGCCDADERSCTSDVTLPSDDVSHKTIDTDVFGLDPEGKNIEYTECIDRSDEWHQAESLMSDYRAILERREHLHSEVASLGHQNMELEKDLESRLKEEVNEQPVFPPRVSYRKGGSIIREQDQHDISVGYKGS